MSQTGWRSVLSRGPFGSRARGRTRRSSHLKFAPHVDGLEVRALLSTLTVTNTDDDVTEKGTLRYELAQAKAGDTVDFDSSLANKTISLTKGELQVTNGVTIQDTAASKLAI